MSLNVSSTWDILFQSAFTEYGFYLHFGVEYVSTFFTMQGYLLIPSFIGLE